MRKRREMILAGENHGLPFKHAPEDLNETLANFSPPIRGDAGNKSGSGSPAIVSRAEKFNLRNVRDERAG